MAHEPDRYRAALKAGVVHGVPPIAITWKPIPGYEGIYEISDEGAVRRITKGGSWNATPGRILKSHAHPTRGYVAIDLCKNGHSKRHRIHRLVLLAFVGLPPTSRTEVNHRNGNVQDNRLQNLEWCSPHENMEHSYQQLNHARTPGSKNGNSKLTEPQVLEIRRLYATGGYTLKALSQMYGVHFSAIARIVNRRVWRHV